MNSKMPQRDGRDGIDHPYKAYENSTQWQLLNKALDELVLNGDLQETTDRVYIVGYLCKSLVPELSTGD